MKKSTVNELEDREAIVDPLTELLREGAQRLMQQAVGVELEALLAEHGGRRTEAGTAGIVRNGFLPERELQTGVGPVRPCCMDHPEGCLIIVFFNTGDNLDAT